MQPTGREKIFTNHVTSKRLICKIYKELIKPNNNKTKQSISKMGRGTE